MLTVSVIQGLLQKKEGNLSFCGFIRQPVVSLSPYPKLFFLVAPNSSPSPPSHFSL